VYPLEIADHVHAEIPSRRQRRHAHPRRVVRLADLLHEPVETALPQQRLQPVVERVSRRARHLRPRRHQLVLNPLRPPHRHRRSPRPRAPTAGNPNFQTSSTGCYPSLILYPYNGSGVAVVVSQLLVTVNANGTVTGTVCASWPNAIGTALPIGQQMSVDPSI